ncbi:MAG TPA: ATP synthase F1 subunit epsilon [Candidatus Saccharimonadales bacterium]|nr:ATP synthase F1 subunit epsilon [Candidatus Saccharimonadales bacterium]
MRFQLITLGGVKFDEDVYEVTLPTSTGEISVLPEHMPLVSLAVPGVITVRHKLHDSSDKFEHFATEGGIIEVDQSGVRILVDEAAHGSEVHAEAEQKALENALKLREQAKDKVSLDQAQAAIDRSQVRLKVAELRRRHQRGI